MGAGISPRAEGAWPSGVGRLARFGHYRTEPENGIIVTERKTK